VKLFVNSQNPWQINKILTRGSDFRKRRVSCKEGKGKTKKSEVIV